MILCNNNAPFYTNHDIINRNVLLDKIRKGHYCNEDKSCSIIWW